MATKKTPPIPRVDSMPGWKELKHYRFFLPELGKELREKKPINGSPLEATTMTARELTLPPMSVVPIHRNQLSEKFFTHQRGGAVNVWTLIKVKGGGERWHNQRLMRTGNWAVVPSNHFHFLVCEDLASVIEIIKSSTAKDVVWHSATARLCKKKKHQTKCPKCREKKSRRHR